MKDITTGIFKKKKINLKLKNIFSTYLGSGKEKQFVNVFYFKDG